MITPFKRKGSLNVTATWLRFLCRRQQEWIPTVPLLSAFHQLGFAVGAQQCLRVAITALFSLKWKTRKKVVSMTMYGTKIYKKK